MRSAGDDASARRLEGIERPPPVSIILDGAPLAAYPGESLATALLAAGRRAFRTTASGAPRGPLCNMGACYDRLVVVEGRGELRACMTEVEAGMRVRSGGDGQR